MPVSVNLQLQSLSHPILAMMADILVIFLHTSEEAGGDQTLPTLYAEVMFVFG